MVASEAAYASRNNVSFAVKSTGGGCHLVASDGVLHPLKNRNAAKSLT
jgi:hypothetical protein